MVLMVNTTGVSGRLHKKQVAFSCEKVTCSCFIDSVLVLFFILFLFPGDCCNGFCSSRVALLGDISLPVSYDEGGER